jgi:hypothetical protein
VVGRQRLEGRKMEEQRGRGIEGRGERGEGRWGRRLREERKYHSIKIKTLLELMEDRSRSRERGVRFRT